MVVSELNLWRIGQVSARSGFPVKTIRYYADLGLLYSTIQRNSVGYRLFTEGVFSRLNFIKRSLKVAGFA